VPLIRVISLSLPLAGFPLIYWYFFTSVPLFAASFVVIRMQGLGLPPKGGRWSSLLMQVPIMFIGLGLGYTEYLILRPEPLVDEFSWRAILIPALILLISTGLLEEVIFRGLMQGASVQLIGPFLGLLYVAFLFAMLHMGYRSFLDVIFVFVVGLGFGLVVASTGRLIGVTMAHGLTNIMLFLILPFVASGDNPQSNLGAYDDCGSRWPGSDPTIQR
jgi:membrane protease YdiL (CAAX protease family)